MTKDSIRIAATFSALFCVGLVIASIGYYQSELLVESGISFTPVTSSSTTPIALSSTRYQEALVPFSFELPKDFKVRIIKETEGIAYVVADAEQKNGFQIYTRTFDEPNAKITEARIKRDISNIVMTHVQKISVEKTEGVSFIGSDTNTREIWFVYGGLLYQINAPVQQEVLLQKVLATWQFEV